MWRAGMTTCVIGVLADGPSSWGLSVISAAPSISPQLRAMFRFTVRAQLAPYASNGIRSFSATVPVLSDVKSRALDPRWLTLIKRRIGKCMMFGLPPAQIEEGGRILDQLAKEWRELVAGSEGFLTEAKRRSLFRHGVVWGEQVWLGHVNNVTYVRYAETARVNWTRNIGTHIDPANKKEWHSMVGSTGIGLILKSIKVDYKFPMTSPDKITVYQKLIPDPSGHLSSQSAFRLEVMILSEARQRPSARCFEDIVLYDYKKNRKTVNLPPFVMDQFKLMWEQQENETERWQHKIADIENRVRGLELESWDRTDAVEDNGSA
ncbi:unnamed protein product [Penicillium salamii]|uniref:Thioesterase/thiol ester dehydrase-isomerase n=1 Tax=Penicillium salamii TaxID=1612424 RepID=A0A9W4J068_9EURO|nr:unnamed protein product [Penicillium salamii]CAG8097343.1 unnamed protein product [Penicillium salamii]CAG8131873.1 unnamed protein product [Penicillium salamii]CAG8278033.1 unnamed protein product [Penicillium salamii]CAG8287799.1 unnamed protein product [Penicillium salamii]